jgi:hypothetical protein
MSRSRASRLRETIAAAGVIVAALAMLVVPSSGLGAARAKDAYRAYVSCANSKPFKVAKRCGYDGRQYFRATFVFRSNVGKRIVKACFKVFGRAPVGGGHACYNLGSIAYKAYPFKVTGVRQRFSVKVTWFAREPNGGGGFKRAASSFLRVHT